MRARMVTCSQEYQYSICVTHIRENNPVKDECAWCIYTMLTTKKVVKRLRALQLSAPPLLLAPTLLLVQAPSQSYYDVYRTIIPCKELMCVCSY